MAFRTGLEDLVEKVAAYAATKYAAVNLPELFEGSLAQRGVRDVMKLLDAGHVHEADALAKMRGVLAPHPVGHPIRMLGTLPSTEGAQVLMLHPERGVTASKFHFREGLTNAGLLTARKRLTEIPHPANVAIRDMQRMEGLHLPIVHNELVPGSTLRSLREKGWLNRSPLSRSGTLPPGTEDTRNQAVLSVRNLQNKARELGLNVLDPNDSNIMIDHSGQGRLIDSIAMRPGVDADPRAGRVRQLDPTEGFADAWDRLEGENFEPERKGPAPKMRPPRRGDPGFSPL
jgi:hypothetical protein